MRAPLVVVSFNCHLSHQEGKSNPADQKVICKLMQPVDSEVSAHTTGASCGHPLVLSVFQDGFLPNLLKLQSLRACVWGGGGFCF